MSRGMKAALPAITGAIVLAGVAVAFSGSSDGRASVLLVAVAAIIVCCGALFAAEYYLNGRTEVATRGEITTRDRFIAAGSMALFVVGLLVVHGVAVGRANLFQSEILVIFVGVLSYYSATRRFRSADAVK
jgi:hypothetical protein